MIFMFIRSYILDKNRGIIDLVTLVVKIMVFILFGILVWI